MKHLRPEGTPFEVMTPEGVPLRFEIASAGARAGGVLIDYTIIFGSILILVLLAAWSGAIMSSFVRSILMLATFLAIHFYFSFFEVRWQGGTPGKRVAGIRVINRFGGPVPGDAVLTRNFLRIIEMFVPMQLISMWGSGSMSDLPWYLVVAGIAWAFILVFLPLFNRSRMRLGDLAAGTVVVRAPKAQLFSDISASSAGEGAKEQRYTFASEQLAIYGEYELHVLEELLRDGGGQGEATTLQTVAKQIIRKIGWQGRVPRKDAQLFLQAFYDALRGHREKRMLFGKRKQDKHADEG